MNAQQFFESAVDSHLKYLRSLTEENRLICVVLTYRKDHKDQLQMYHIHTEGLKPINAIKPLIDQTQPDYYIAFNEGYSWLVSKDEMAKYNIIELKKMKTRKEILTCFGRSKDGTETFDKSFEILRLGNRVDFIEYKGAELRSRNMP